MSNTALNLAELTIARIAREVCLTEDAAAAFRIVAHSNVSRSSGYHVAFSNDMAWDNDQALIDGGLITCNGRREYSREGFGYSIRAVLTPAGQALAERAVAFERALRTRYMDADGLAAWERAVATA